MNKRSVLFLPQNVKVSVEPGTDVLTAAGMANIELKASCGGDGTCGKCVISVTMGQAEIRDGHHLADRLQEQGYSLACQTYVQNEDLVVEIPKSTRMANHQVLMDKGVTLDDTSDPLQRYLLSIWQLSSLLKEGQEDILCGHPLRPMLRSVKLEMSPPDLTDNCDDLSRLLVALRKETVKEHVEVPVKILRSLAEVMRADNFRVTVLILETPERTEIIKIEPGHVDRPLYGLAVDIGTTTVVAYLLDLNTGSVLGTAGSHNRQARFGDDVISRIVYSMEEHDGLEQLHQAVVDTINGLVFALLEKHRKIKESDIQLVLTAGNTTMAHLFLGIPPKYIRLEPYIPTANFFPPVRGRDLGLRVNPDAYVISFPAIASYVGGDIVSGAMMSGIAKDDQGISLLIDIGTNGEMVLGSSEWLVTCSCSAGPAFEGSGITFGMRAMQGAIERVEIDPQNFKVTYKTVHNAKPLGICGSALIDCLSKMRETGIIDRAGKLQTQLKTPRMRTGENGPEFVLAWQTETELDTDIVITEADIKNLLRAKGAVFAGIRTLLQMMNLEVEHIDKIYVAGGFGNYLNIRDAIKIGLLPDLPVSRYKFIGNSSVKGTCAALLSQEAWEEARDLATKMTYIELSVGNLFMEEFISSLFIPHTDLTLFPTVEY